MNDLKLHVNDTKINMYDLTFYKDENTFYNIKPITVDGEQKLWVQHADGEGGSFDLDFMFDAIDKHFKEIF